MRARTLRWCCCLVVTAALVSWSWTRGQEPTTNPPGQTAAKAAPSSAPSKAPTRDFSKLPPLQQQMALSAQRGADWLFRMNGTDGRFAHGLVPALRTTLDGDHYLRQAGAAVALARAARFLGNEEYTARARQAVLTLLAETEIDPKRPGVRTT